MEQTKQSVLEQQRKKMEEIKKKYSYSLNKDLDHIWQNIYLGDRSDSENLEALQKANITHILITGNNLKAFYEGKIKYKILALENYNWNVDLSEIFDEAVDFMKQGNCFVHCIAGMHRSPTFVIAYLIREGKMTLAEAYKITKKQRSLIDPPQRFLEQLLKYQIKCGIPFSEEQKTKRIPKSNYSELH